MPQEPQSQRPEIDHSNVRLPMQGEPLSTPVPTQPEGKSYNVFTLLLINIVALIAFLFIVGASSSSSQMGIVLVAPFVQAIGLLLASIVVYFSGKSALAQNLAITGFIMLFIGPATCIAGMMIVLQ